MDDNKTCEEILQEIDQMEKDMIKRLEAEKEKSNK